MVFDNIFKKWKEPTSEIITKLKDQFLRKHEFRYRPSWSDFLLSQACLVSERSIDAQTQCGCIITDQHNRVLGQGYNGFPREVNDNLLPNLRPEKYPWMIHAEVNAILNSHGNLEEATAYITGPPCHNCLLFMWQHGIKNIIYTDYSLAVMTEQDETTKNLREYFQFVTKGEMSIHYMPLSETNFSHIERMMKKYKNKQTNDNL